MWLKVRTFIPLTFGQVKWEGQRRRKRRRRRRKRRRKRRGKGRGGEGERGGSEQRIVEGQA